MPSPLRKTPFISLRSAIPQNAAPNHSITRYYRTLEKQIKSFLRDFFLRGAKSVSALTLRCEKFVLSRRTTS
jgi:hypothetical protein